MTDGGGSVKSEKQEIDELNELFGVGVGMARESTLPVALYAKLEVFEENRRRAEKARKEREKRAITIQENAEARFERSQAARAKMREKHGLTIEEHKANNLAQGIATREREAMWQIQREEEKKKFIDKGRQCVLGHKELQKQMQESEDRDAARKRMEGLEQRKLVDNAVKQKAEEQRAIRQSSVMAVKNDGKAGQEKVEGYMKVNKTDKAANTRQVTQQWKDEKRRMEEEYMADAADKRAKALAGREQARKVKEELWQKNTSTAHKERENDHLVAEEKERILNKNKNMRAERYKQRFATQQEADEFEMSQLNHLYKFVK